jgi:hypothetical protein
MTLTALAGCSTGVQKLGSPSAQTTGALLCATGIRFSCVRIPLGSKQQGHQLPVSPVLKELYSLR